MATMSKIRKWPGQLELICARCDGKFFMFPSEVGRRGGGQYCGKRCYRDGPVTLLEERFWAGVKKTETCWLWIKANNGGDGRTHIYGVMGRGRRGEGLIRTHRYSWELHNGPIPEGLCVLHRCDEPLCIRPDHLFLGTLKDNTQDMVTKGRASGGRPFWTEASRRKYG